MVFNKILKLSVTNFRNLHQDTVEFFPAINCIFGDNGNGKTNLLEAIYFLAQKKSFRKNATFPQILSMDSDSGEITFMSLLSDKDKQSTFTGRVKQLDQEWYENGRITKRPAKIPAVFINPFDSYAFHTTASFRRHWFDGSISNMNPLYRASIVKYLRCLKMRNTLLSKRPEKYKEQIFAIDKDLARYSREISEKRIQFVNEIQICFSQTFREIFSEEHNIQIDIISKFKELSENQIVAKLRENFPADDARGHTEYGVHVDDYVFHFNGINAFEYCSLGQQKMAYLSLNFAYIELFRYKLSSYPIVLIDDVSGELDEHRWRRLIDYLVMKKFQVFITTANEHFKHELEKISEANKLYMSDGRIHGRSSRDN